MVAGVNRVITMDLHADQIQGFFEVPVDYLFGSTLFPALSTTSQSRTFVSPIPEQRHQALRSTLRQASWRGHVAICYKQRKVANQVENNTVIGDADGKDVVIVDDMCDTAGTLTKSGDLMMEISAVERPCRLHPRCSAVRFMSVSRRAPFKNSS